MPNALTAADRQRCIGLIAEGIRDPNALLILCDLLEEADYPYQFRRCQQWSFLSRMQLLMYFGWRGVNAWRAVHRAVRGYGAQVAGERVIGETSGAVYLDFGDPAQPNVWERDVLTCGPQGAWNWALLPQGRMMRVLCSSAHCRRCVWRGLTGHTVSADVEVGLVELRERIYGVIRREGGFHE